MTADELKTLHDTIDRLRDEISEIPQWQDDTPLGIVSNSDWEILGIAASIVHRLHLDAKYPTVNAETRYLPVPS